MKPIVQYRAAMEIKVGKPAFVVPVDHPSPLVSNTGWVSTSEVLNYVPEMGIFETRNTIYMPEEK